MRSQVSKLFIATCVGMVPVHGAIAQQAAAETIAPAIEDIVVTAQRRETRLQDTPISITAVTAAAIEQRGYTNISEITGATPNLQFDATAPVSGSSNASSIFIRGVGQTDFLLTTDPGVGVYLDGVYIARSVGGVLDLGDVERVEVLRGPQGTLFGKNTIGGAISLTTNKPVQRLEGLGEVTVGSFRRLDVKGVLNIPITDTLAFRVVAQSANRRGYAERVLTGQRLGNKNADSARASLRWQPTADTDINLAFDITRAREESPAATAGASGLGPVGDGALTNLYNIFVAPTLVVPGFGTNVRYDNRWLTGDPYKSFGTGPTGSDSDVYGVSLNVEHRFGSVTLKSITGYRHLDARFARDFDNSPLDILSTSNDITHRQFSQELNLSGRLFDDRLNYVVGLYYFEEDGRDAISVPVVPALFNSPLMIPVSVAGTYRIDNRNYAGFMQVGYKLTDALSVTLGGRYSSERRRIRIDYFLTDLNLPLLANPNRELSFNDFTPRVGLEYKASESVFAYASYAKGFKAGGFTARYVSPAPEPQAFDPEEVETYEVGLKTDLLNGKLRLNGAAFTSNYRNIQVVAFRGVAPVNVNAAAGRIRGFEIEATAVPTAGLTFTAAAGYLDAKYTRVDAAAFAGITFPITLASRFVNTPRWTLNGSAEYRFGMAGGDVSFRGDVQYQTATFKDAANTPGLVQPAYALVNVRLAYQPRDGNWSAALFGRNITDTRYITSGVGDIASFGTVEVNFARPAEWGASLKYKF